MSAVLWVVEEKIGEKWVPRTDLVPWSSRAWARKEMAFLKRAEDGRPRLRVVKYVREEK